MKRTEAVNTFNDGLVMDINPMIASNKGLCNALNATLITQNGNEQVLQNDMGNGRVETAYLPEGYVPLGTTEFGGIIYIVSYNPQINKCQIGSFPSPERNISENEISDSESPELMISDFIKNDKDNNPIIKATTVKKKITTNTLHIGDKFIVSAKNLALNTDYIKDLNSSNNSNKFINLKIATIDNNGRIIDLDNLLEYTTNNCNYHFKNQENKTSAVNQDLSNYRDIISSDYNIFSSNISGELYVIAELDIIDSFTITWRLESIEEKTETSTENLQKTYSEYTLIFDITSTSKSGIKPTNIKIGNEFISLTSDQIKYPIKIYNNSSKEINLEITPCMEYGIADQFKTNINIDLDLFNKEKISQSVWRYYKEDSRMILNYNLNSYLFSEDTIDYVRHYFIPYDKLTKDLCTKLLDHNLGLNVLEETLNDFYYYPLESRKSYSGNFMNQISFNQNFTENNIYFVVTLIKITSNGNSENYKLFHCLYTNGVFNNDYINSTEDNFDLLELKLEDDLSFKEVSQFNNTTDILKDPSYINDSDINKIQGCTRTNLFGTVNLNPTLQFKNNYKTFDIDQNFISFAKSNIICKLDNQHSQVNTGINNVDPDYVKILQQTKQDHTLNEQIKQNSVESGDWYKVSEVNGKLNIEGQFYNKISSNTILKKAKVKNYFKPVASTLEEFQKYGISMTDSGFSLPTSIVGLGMANGGADNTGTGGVFHVFGLTNLRSSGINLVLKNSSVYSGISKNGNRGIGSFPDTTFSSYIEKYYSKNIFVPVVLMGVGGENIIVDNTPHKYSETGIKSQDTKINWFCEDQSAPYKVMWLFMKSDNFTQTLYLPFNTFYKISDINYTSQSYTLQDYLVSLLSQIYVKTYDSDIELDKYSVKDISYFDNITELLNIELQYKLEKDPDNINPLTFNKIQFSNIQDHFKLIYNDKLPSCLKSPELNYEKEYFCNFKYKFNLKDLLLDEYLKHQSESIFIEAYVKNPFSDVTITPPNELSNTLYSITDNKLVQISSDFIGKKVNMRNGKMELGNNILNFPVKQYFTYDQRENVLLLKERAYDSSKSIQAFWDGYESHKETKERGFTYFKDIQLIADKGIDKL